MVGSGGKCIYDMGFVFTECSKNGFRYPDKLQEEYQIGVYRRNKSFIAHSIAISLGTVPPRYRAESLLCNGTLQ